jgi:hypothetical protein
VRQLRIENGKLKIRGNDFQYVYDVTTSPEQCQKLKKINLEEQTPTACGRHPLSKGGWEYAPSNAPF